MILKPSRNLPTKEAICRASKMSMDGYCTGGLPPSWAITRATATDKGPSSEQPLAHLWPPPPKRSATVATFNWPLLRRLTRKRPSGSSRKNAATSTSWIESGVDRARTGSLPREEPGLNATDSWAHSGSGRRQDRRRYRPTFGAMGVSFARRAEAIRIPSGREAKNAYLSLRLFRPGHDGMQHTGIVGSVERRPDLSSRSGRRGTACRSPGRPHKLRRAEHPAC